MLHDRFRCQNRVDTQVYDKVWITENSTKFQQKIDMTKELIVYAVKNQNPITKSQFDNADKKIVYMWTKLSHGTSESVNIYNIGTSDYINNTVLSNSNDFGCTNDTLVINHGEAYIVSYKDRLKSNGLSELELRNENLSRLLWVSFENLNDKLVDIYVSFVTRFFLLKLIWPNLISTNASTYYLDGLFLIYNNIKIALKLSKHITYEKRNTIFNFDHTKISVKKKITKSEHCTSLS